MVLCYSSPQQTETGQGAENRDKRKTFSLLYSIFSFSHAHALLSKNNCFHSNKKDTPKSAQQDSDEP